MIKNFTFGSWCYDLSDFCQLNRELPTPRALEKDFHTVACNFGAGVMKVPTAIDGHLSDIGHSGLF